MCVFVKLTAFEFLFTRPDTPAFEESNKESKEGHTAKKNQDGCHDRDVVTKAVVRFHLWLKGTLTVDHLIPKLKSSIQFALYDTITELHVLRPPLCVMAKTEDPDDLPPMEFQKSNSKLLIHYLNIRNIDII